MHARTTPNARKGTPVKAPSRADGRPSLSTSIVIIGTRRCTRVFVRAHVRLGDRRWPAFTAITYANAIISGIFSYARSLSASDMSTRRRAGYLGNNVNQILESKSLLLAYIIRLSELGHVQPVTHAVKFESAQYEMVVARQRDLS